MLENLGLALLFSCRADLADELQRVTEEAEFAETPVASYQIVSDGGKSDFRAM